jgi:hypothetical protein
MAKRRVPKNNDGDEVCNGLLAVVMTDVAAATMEDVTNINATDFCPYIQHKKDYMPRKIATCRDAPNDFYHWWQRRDFTNVQFCKLKRNPEEDFEKCCYKFKKCDDYLDAQRDKNGIH